MSNLKMRHSSTQVNVCSSPHVLAEGCNKPSLQQFGNLYHYDDPSGYVSNRSENRHGSITSASHNYNVLAVQGEYIPMTYNGQNTMGINFKDSEPGLNLDNNYKSIQNSHGPKHSELDGFSSNNDEEMNPRNIVPEADEYPQFELHQGSHESFNNPDAQHEIQEVLMIIKEKLDQATRTTCITREDKACLTLEAILRNAGAPLYMYDAILKWAIKYKNRLPSRVPLINRNKLYSGLAAKMYGDADNDMMPKEVPTVLPSGRRCGVTVFNIYSQITSLLANRNINKWSNYIFDPKPDNPFHLNIFSDWESSTFGDIETSIWYQRTH
jgi:hypothetical protein